MIPAPRRADRAAFLRPDAWHRPATYWFWHHLPDDEQIRRQVGEMHDAGFRSFQIQARLSYPIGEYLDESYLRACRVAVDEAAARGMVVGIYDEYNWQTGHAGGRAVAGHDALRERQLFWTRVWLRDGRGQGRVSGIRSATEGLGPAAMAWHYEGAQPLWADWRIEHIWAGAAERASDITAAGSVSGDAEGCRVLVELVDLGDLAELADEGAFVLVSARCATSRLVNPLDRVAVERFVEAGYDPFRAVLGEHFGATVQYIFFDQPHAVYYDWAEREGDPRSAIPVHSSLLAAAEKRWGDDFSRVLSAVIDETESATELQWRAQFWQFFSEHAMETFLGTLRDWSHAHGLRQSGHEVLGHVGSWHPGASFANWDLRANFGLDHFGVDAYRDLTAVDAQDAVGQLSPRLGDSVARASGRSGTIVEQYFMTPPPGGEPWSGHWGLSLDELRSVAIRHHFAGMRQMVFHGFYQTHGHGGDHESLRNPRFDFPPGVNFEPWFRDFHPSYAEESARLSEFLDGIGDEPEVLLLWPLRTIWTHGQTGEHAEHVGEWARVLTEANVAFRLVDERQLDGLADAVPSARVLVLPAVRTLRDAASIAALAELADAGVRVVTSGARPEVLQMGDASAVGPWRVVGAGALAVVPSAASVRDRLGLPRPFAAQAADAGALVRSGLAADGGRRLALYNDGARAVVVTLPPGTTEWDPADGAVRAVGAVSLTVEPAELRLFVLASDADAVEVAPASETEPARELATGWTLQLPGREEEPVDVTAGWQGSHPTYSGSAVYRTRFVATPGADLLLRLPRVAGAAMVSVNGIQLGARGWRPYRFAVPGELVTAGDNLLEVTVTGSAANGFYAGTGLRSVPEPSGLLGVPTVEEID